MWTFGVNQVNILLLGAAGFIGTNLTIALAKNPQNNITVVDVNKDYFGAISQMHLENVRIVTSDLTVETDFTKFLEGQDLLYHLVSTTIPGTSNQHVVQELMGNVIFSAKLLEACVTCQVKRVVFLSSGGTVYGMESGCPLNEQVATYPISSYGVQKVTIEKLLYLYHHMYGLDYRIIRLANPYGPYQRPNGVLGAVTTFTYKALKGEPISVYGDGSVVRDFIYIEDVIRAANHIVFEPSPHKIFNLGCGYGTSLLQVLQTIEKTLELKLDIHYLPNRPVDVPVNYLDISRYEESFGPLNPISLSEGIRKTAAFMRTHYNL